MPSTHVTVHASCDRRHTVFQARSLCRSPTRSQPPASWCSGRVLNSTPTCGKDTVTNESCGHSTSTNSDHTTVVHVSPPTRTNTVWIVKLPPTCSKISSRVVDVTVDRGCVCPCCYKTLSASVMVETLLSVGFVVIRLSLAILIVPKVHLIYDLLLS